MEDKEEYEEPEDDEEGEELEGKKGTKSFTPYSGGPWAPPVGSTHQVARATANWTIGTRVIIAKVTKDKNTQKKV